MRKAIVVSTVFAVGVAGCGGASETTTVAAPTSDRAAFIAQADVVCEEANEVLVEVNADLEASSNEDQAVDLVEEGVQEVESTLNVLGDMEPPDEIAGQWEDYLSWKADSLDAYERAVKSAIDGDAEQATIDRAKAEAASARASRSIREIGFDDCGSS